MTVEQRQATTSNDLDRQNEQRSAEGDSLHFGDGTGLIIYTQRPSTALTEQGIDSQALHRT